MLSLFAFFGISNIVTNSWHYGWPFLSSFLFGLLLFCLLLSLLLFFDGMALRFRGLWCRFRIWGLGLQGVCLGFWVLGF